MGFKINQMLVEVLNGFAAGMESSFSRQFPIEFLLVAGDSVEVMTYLSVGVQGVVALQVLKNSLFQE